MPAIKGIVLFLEEIVQLFDGGSFIGIGTDVHDLGAQPFVVDIQIRIFFRFRLYRSPPGGESSFYLQKEYFCITLYPMNWLQNAIVVVISFLIARIMIDSEIHRSAVRYVLEKSQASISSLLTGVMLLSYGASLFFTNMVVVLTMIPVIKVILEGIKDPAKRKQVATPIILALIYGANIGGMGSLTGSPLNLVYIGLTEFYQLDGRQGITFFSWLLVGIPSTLVLMAISRVLLKRAEIPVKLDNRLLVKDDLHKPESPARVKRYTIFFSVNLSVIIILTAGQFILKPATIVFHFNIIDICLILFFLAVFFFSFIFPRGTGRRTRDNYKRNVIFLLLYIVFFVPIFFVETAKEVARRLYRPALGTVKCWDDRLFRLFRRVCSRCFNTPPQSMRRKNPLAFVSMNRIIYDLPFGGFLFMGVILGAVYLLVVLGDNPATPQIDGYLARFLESISQKVLLLGRDGFWFLLLVAMTAIFFTEIVNNTTVVLILAPLLLKMSGIFQFNPLYLLLALVIAASGAFMTPVATPVNAICFASLERVSFKKMLKFGFFMNILGGLWITLLFYFLNRIF